MGGVLENSSEPKVSVFGFDTNLDDFTKFWMRFAHSRCASRILEALRALWRRFASSGGASRLLEALRAFWRRFAPSGGSCTARHASLSLGLKRLAPLANRTEPSVQKWGEVGVTIVLTNYRIRIKTQCLNNDTIMNISYVSGVLSN